MLAKHVTHAIRCTRKRQSRCVQLRLSSPRTISDSSSWCLEANTVHTVNYPEATVDLQKQKKEKQMFSLQLLVFYHINYGAIRRDVHVSHLCGVVQTGWRNIKRLWCREFSTIWPFKSKRSCNWLHTLSWVLTVLDWSLTEILLVTLKSQQQKTLIARFAVELCCRNFLP